MLARLPPTGDEELKRAIAMSLEQEKEEEPSSIKGKILRIEKMQNAKKTEHFVFTFIFSDDAEEEVPRDEESKRVEDDDVKAEMVRGSQGRKRSAPSDKDQVNLLRTVTCIKMQQCKIQSDNN